MKVERLKQIGKQTRFIQIGLRCVNGLVFNQIDFTHILKIKKIVKKLSKLNLEINYVRKSLFKVIVVL